MSQCTRGRSQLHGADSNEDRNDSTNKWNMKIEIIEQVTKKADGMSVLCSNASHVYASLM